MCIKGPVSQEGAGNIFRREGWEFDLFSMFKINYKIDPSST